MRAGRKATTRTFWRRKVVGAATALVLTAAHGASVVPREQGKSPTRAPEGTAVAADLLASLPLRFQANEGQTDPAVRFLAQQPGYSLFLTPGEAVLSLARPAGKGDRRRTVVRMRLRNGESQPVVTGSEPVAGRTSHFRGDDPRRWSRGVTSYAKVRYEGVYPGVDLVYHGDHGELEYDFIVAPGADPGAIELDFDGVDDVVLGGGGDLVLSTASGTVRQRRPLVYQDAVGGRRHVAGSYSIGGDDQVRFLLGPYDRALPLVIDPVLTYSSYLGGADADAATAIAVDPAGRAYITGQTQSADFPAEGAVQTDNAGFTDAFVAAFDTNAAGARSLLWSTYLGSSTGGDRGTGIALGPRGDVFVTGTTTKANPTGPADFPTTPDAFQPYRPGSGREVQPGTSGDGNGFVARLATGADGATLSYSSYLGGTGDDLPAGIAVGDGDDVFITGETGSTNFPTSRNAFDATCGVDGRCDPASAASAPDAFLTRLDTHRAGAEGLVYSTYLGDAGRDIGAGVAVVGEDAYVAGTTGSSSQFLGARGAAFVVRLTTRATQDGRGPGLASLTYSARFGGSNFRDLATGIAVGARSSPPGTLLPAADIYVTGQTFSSDFPTTAGAYQRSLVGTSDAFVARLDTTADASLVYSTYLGGREDPGRGEAGNAIAVGPDGTAWVTGITSALQAPGAFPTTANALPKTKQGAGDSVDGFVARVDTRVDTAVSGSGSLRYATLLGGDRDDRPAGISIDQAANVYVTGSTTSGDFPSEAPFQGEMAGSSDAFVAKIASAESAEGAPVVTAVTPRGGPTSGGTTVVITGTGFRPGSLVRFGETQVPAENITVSGDGTSITAVSPAGDEGRVFVTVANGGATSGRTRTTVFAYARQGAWAAAAAPRYARFGHTATLLADGRVLVVGGIAMDAGGGSSFVGEAELYDPRSAPGGSWTSIPGPVTTRYRHTATLLRDGKVLVVGGVSGIVDGRAAMAATAELFDPDAQGQRGAGTWLAATAGPSEQPITPRHGHTASLLPDGTVLVAGGSSGSSQGGLAGVEIYTHAGTSGTWSAARDVARNSTYPTATLVGGRVLMVAGKDRPETFGDEQRWVPVLYDPGTGRWTERGPLQASRLAHSASLLPTGQVLVAGGRRELTSTRITDTAELHDPAAPDPTWTLTDSMETRRFGHANALLPGGRVLVAGGAGTIEGRDGSRFAPGLPLVAAEVYDPASGTWSLVPDMGTARGPRFSADLPDAASLAPGPTATLLSADPFGSAFTPDSEKCGTNCGKVLVVGGSGDRTADLFTPGPSVSGISPADGPQDQRTRVEITGTGFRYDAGTPTPTITFGGVPATDVLVESYAKLSAVSPLPVDASVVPVEVTTSTGTGVSPQPFRYLGRPGAVRDLTATADGTTGMRLTFSAPGSVAALAPPAERYLIRQARTPITDDQAFDQALALCPTGGCAFVPGSVGAGLTFTVTDLRPGTTYHYAVRAVDEGGEGPLSNAAQATTTRAASTENTGPAPAPVDMTAAACPLLAAVTAGRVALRAGYSLVGLPEGTPAPGLGVLFGWKDQGAGGAYDRLDAGRPVATGRGYWSWAPCPSIVNLSGPGRASVRLPLRAYTASMVGNPSGTSPARVSGFDYAARWDPTMHGGAGGYHLSGYRQAQPLSVGEGIWVFSYVDTTVVIEAG